MRRSESADRFGRMRFDIDQERGEGDAGYSFEGTLSTGVIQKLQPNFGTFLQSPNHYAVQYQAEEHRLAPAYPC
jgi:hypothetical protein